MLGCVYLILAALLGREITHNFLPEQRMREKGITPLWVTFAASFGSGVLLMTWAVYIAAWLLSVYSEAENPLFGANLMVMAAVGIFLLLCCYRRKGSFGKFIKRLSGEVPPAKEIVFLLILLAGITWIMVFVFHVSDGYLYSGFTVFGDYAPHTAMMRSFSLGNNFPTQYPHFGGEDVKYHFMFQFLVGNLEFLGLRLDIAYNSVSVFALLGFLMVLYSIARRVTGSGKAGALTVVFFFFRSALTFFQFLWEHLRTGDLIQVLQENTSFIGYTTNEDWGLWNFNVYLNQRHLAFGLLIVALVLWMYLDWVEQGCRHKEKGLVWFRNRLFSKEAWKCRYVENALAAGLLIGMTSFWNGAAVIGGLLILMGFAVCSDGKLDYLITAVTAVVFSVLQTRLFMKGSSVEAAFQWGFIAEDKSTAGVLWYLIQMSGIFFVGALILFFFYKKRLQRAVLVSCLFPLVFAFCFSLTPDITVNHKYIMISYAFLAMFWAGAVCLLFRKKWQGRILAAVLTVCLTITGIYDFVIIVRDNGPGHRVTVNTNSSLTDWLAQNLDSRDLILTPEYSISEVTMAGVMMYLGWPYYAWSAGYDTYDRAENAKEIYTSRDPERVKSLVQQERITYILFEKGMTFEEETCIETTIKSVYRLAYQSEDGRIRIYET